MAEPSLSFLICEMELVVPLEEREELGQETVTSSRLDRGRWSRDQRSRP